MTGDSLDWVIRGKESPRDRRIEGEWQDASFQVDEKDKKMSHIDIIGKLIVD